MELIKGFTLAIFSSAVARQITREFNAWTPWIIERLTRRAVAKLPENQRERFEEEWRSHIDEIPGDMGKLFVALGFGSAAHNISSILNPPRNRFLEGTSGRVIDICFSILALMFLLPTFLMVALLVRYESPGSIFVREVSLGRNGQNFNAWKFRSVECPSDRSMLHLYQSKTTSLPRMTRVGKFLQACSLNELPMFINVLRGEITLLGLRRQD